MATRALLSHCALSPFCVLIATAGCRAQVKAASRSLPPSMISGMHMSLHTGICMRVNTPAYKQNWGFRLIPWPSGRWLCAGSLQCTVWTGSEVTKGFGWPLKCVSEMVLMTDWLCWRTLTHSEKLQRGRHAIGPPLAEIWIARSGEPLRVRLGNRTHGFRLECKVLQAHKFAVAFKWHPSLVGLQ